MQTATSNNNIVLIVDDSPEALGMLNEALENAAMTPLVALEGKQAIAICKKMRPDLILLDALMPQMDGFETCKLIKSDAQIKNIPIIFMTGLTDTASIVKGFEVGGVDYVTKPINPLELIARIKTHLSNARATLSAQSALDITGRSLLAVDKNGEKLWATPQINDMLSQLEQSNLLLHMQQRIAQWLSEQPATGNRLPLSINNTELTAVYMGLSEHKEHLITIINRSEEREKEALKEHFGITSREAEVYVWLTKGKTNREIAQILDLSPRTVNKHLEQLFRKLGVENRTTAAAMAIQCLQNKL